jgi:hypothetical protein
MDGESVDNLHKKLMAEIIQAELSLLKISRYLSKLIEEFLQEQDKAFADSATEKFERWDQKKNRSQQLLGMVFGVMKDMKEIGAASNSGF